MASIAPVFSVQLKQVIKKYNSSISLCTSTTKTYFVYLLQDETAADWQGVKKKRLQLQGTKKKGCKAVMRLKYIELYPEHKVGNYSLDFVQ